LFQRASLSPGEQAARERALNRAHSPEHKKLKRTVNNNEETSDGEKSDADLVVDDANEGPTGAANGNHHSPRENGIDGKKSPRSPLGSETSQGSKKREDSGKKNSKPATPTAKPPGNGPPPLPSEFRVRSLHQLAGVPGPHGGKLDNYLMCPGVYPFPDGVTPPALLNGLRPIPPGGPEASRPAPQGGKP
jgi:hypothetical protein